MMGLFSWRGEMNLCSEDHDEICYEGRICPLCDALEDADITQEEMQKEIDQLKSELEDLEG